MDTKTGIHEPTVIIPWWLVINPVVTRNFYNCVAYDCTDGWNTEHLSQADMKAMSYNRDRINEILGG